MIEKFEWLYTTKVVTDIIKKICSLILILFLFIIYHITLTRLIIFQNSKLKENYILISMTKLNSILCAMIPIVVVIVIYFYIKIQKITKGKVYTKKLFITNKIIFCNILIILFLAFIYNTHKYTLVYTEKIISCNIFKSLEKTYNYSDINQISLGVKLRGRIYPSLYYNIYLKDSNRINLSNGIFLNENALQSLTKFNENILIYNVSRNIDRTYLDILIKNCTERDKKIYRELFENK